MSSKLTADGRRVVVTTPSPGLEVGDVFYVLGDSLEVGAGAYYFMAAAKLSGRRNGHTKPRKTVRDWQPVDAPSAQSGAQTGENGVTEPSRAFVPNGNKSRSAP